MLIVPSPALVSVVSGWHCNTDNFVSLFPKALSCLVLSHIGIVSSLENWLNLLLLLFDSSNPICGLADVDVSLSFLILLLKNLPDLTFGVTGPGIFWMLIG